MGAYIDLPSDWRDHEVEACNESFEDHIERMLKPLQGMRLRVSLFAIKVGALSLEHTLALVQIALAPIGSTGMLRDGYGGLLYLGPRPAGPTSDDRLEQRIADVVGWTAFHLTEHYTVADVRLVAVHQWLDELAFSDEMVEKLVSRHAIYPPAAALRHRSV